jgi:V/A-type H+-transporting ATPase subunit A
MSTSPGAISEAAEGREASADQVAGRLIEIAGSLVRAAADRPVGLGEVVRVGEERLLGEAIGLDEGIVTAQVYEETAGLRPGAPFFSTGRALEVELGPGLLGGVFDGTQRPLEPLALLEGAFLGRGRILPALDRDRLWEFEPRVRPGDTVAGGAVVGIVRETSLVEHRVLVPPGASGRVVEVVMPGARRVADVVAVVSDDAGHEWRLSLLQTWPVRRPRPFRARLPLAEPLVTGQRVLDTFLPLPRGGAASMPGGFGTGKTVLQHQLCKWAQADVVVYVGCGERGNEMTRILRELPVLSDPRTGRTLAERTVLVANTSNMPVSAREASIYTGVTIAEYYRDMGYQVALLADSTSRWAEALREISGRLEEMPAEEGYPPYLSSRLAAYYERAGRVTTLDGGEGSVTLISAISPPGGDLTEPVTRHTQRFARTFWSLDKELAEARVFPAVSVRFSYSDVPAALAEWWSREVSPDWPRLRLEALGLLEEAARLEATARLVGSESLPERQRFLLRLAALLEEAFLRQSAFDAKDASCAPARQVLLLSLLLRFRDRGLKALEAGASSARLTELPVVAELERAKSTFGDDELAGLAALANRIEVECASLSAAGGAEP